MPRAIIDMDAAPKPPAEWMAQHKIIIESLAGIVRLCHPEGLKWREEMISREPVIAFVMRIRGATDAISDYLRHAPKVPEGMHTKAALAAYEEWKQRKSRNEAPGRIDWAYHEFQRHACKASLAIVEGK